MIALSLVAKRALLMLGIMLALFAAMTAATRVLDSIEHGAVRDIAHRHQAISLALMDVDHIDHADHVAAVSTPYDSAPDDQGVPHHHHHGDTGSNMVLNDQGWTSAPAGSRLAAIPASAQVLASQPPTGLSRPPRGFTQHV